MLSAHAAHRFVIIGDAMVGGQGTETRGVKVRLPLLHCDLATAPGEHEDGSDEPRSHAPCHSGHARKEGRSMGRPHAPRDKSVDCYLKRIKLHSTYEVLKR